MKKALLRFGVGTARIALSTLVVAVLLTIRLCGGNTSGVKREIASGGSTIGVVKYVVGKYNEFTA
ncbi:MAG: hypothetical protein IKZ81_08215 [Clostridia bacterium]|nr:hypothetical protein [Clostridia bacterium]